jgi:hypothetical protein
MLCFIDNSSLLIIAIIFIAAGAITWVAGITLAKTTDTLDTRWNIGDALGGLVLLGIAGSLPEIAVVWERCCTSPYTGYHRQLARRSFHPNTDHRNF